MSSKAKIAAVCFGISLAGRREDQAPGQELHRHGAGAAHRHNHMGSPVRQIAPCSRHVQRRANKKGQDGDGKSAKAAARYLRTHYVFFHNLQEDSRTC